MIYFSFSFFHTLKFTYTQLVFGSIAFTFFKLGSTVLGSLPQASHNNMGEFWPIPPDRAGVTESGL
jgi:hypothetical protein